MIDLREALYTWPHWSPSTDGLCRLTNAFLGPGFWVLFAASARAKGIASEKVRYPSEDHRSYAKALGLPGLLDENAESDITRKTEGKRYARLTHLKGAEAADQATGRINSCVREILAGSPSKKQLASDLSFVIGELHDNVAAHTDAVGVSMAQRLPELREHPVEIGFAIADLGGGFSRKLRQYGIEHRDDAEAIEWCLTEGKSTAALGEPKDEWAQVLPDDAIGNPYPDSIERAYNSANHHQGLGLATLVKRVKEYEGVLEIVSGRALYLLQKDGIAKFESLEHGWDGVAVSCQFRQDAVSSGVELGVDSAITTLRKRFRTGGNK